MGYSNGFVHLSIGPSIQRHTILSPQLLLHFSRVFLKLSNYCSHALKIIFYGSHAQLICTTVMILCVFQQYILSFFNCMFCLQSSRNFHWILVKPFSCCSHDLKTMILYRSRARLNFTEVMVLCQFQLFCQQNILVCTTAPSFVKGFS